MNKKGLTDAEIINQGHTAAKREEADQASGLRAKAAWYDHASGYVMMVLTSERLFGVPVRAIPYLKGLSPAQLSRVTLSPSGGGLHWEELDIHLSVPGLLREAVGPTTLVREWARTAGRVKNPARAAASRANGAKGGRPRNRKTKAA